MKISLTKLSVQAPTPEGGAKELFNISADDCIQINGNFKCRRIAPIKRTRKRQIERAKFMNHTGYEWSQWWHKTARKPKRWKK